MQFEIILILIPVALLIRLLSNTAGYRTLLSAVGIITIYLLQPEMPIRYLGFWLPTLTVFLVILCWMILSPVEAHRSKETHLFLHLTGLLIGSICVLRYVDLDLLNSFSRPPQIQVVLAVILPTGIFLLHFSRIPKLQEKNFFSANAAIILLFILFIILKTPYFNHLTGQMLSRWNGQGDLLLPDSSLHWLGYSYIAFRLIHTLRDYQTGRTLPVTLQEYFNYVLFFPSLSAGPIDRLERFVKNYRSISTTGLSADLLNGGKRLAIGLLKKFFLADSLAVFALSPGSIQQVQSTPWMWVMLYGYALQIYFDFSGYTDIAIGLGKIMGISLPENFNRPYLKPTLTLFWNNWHITLTQWVRSYLFNPLARALRTSQVKDYPRLILFISQMATMVFIGLWHGITWNFLIWGAWHGLGLFLQNRWSDRLRPFYSCIQGRPIHQVLNALSVFVTFNYVALGWIWFVMPNPQSSMLVFSRLLGGN